MPDTAKPDRHILLYALRHVWRLYNRGDFPNLRFPVLSQKFPAETAANRYDQLLVIRNPLPVPTAGRFPDLSLSAHNRLPDFHQ